MLIVGLLSESGKTCGAKEIGGIEKLFISYLRTIQATPDKKCARSNVFFLRDRVPISLVEERQMK